MTALRLQLGSAPTQSIPELTHLLAFHHTQTHEMPSLQLSSTARNESSSSIFSPTHHSPVYTMFTNPQPSIDSHNGPLPSIPDIAFALLSPQHSPASGTTSSKTNAAAKRMKPLKIIVSQRKNSTASQTSSIAKAAGAIHVHPNAIPSFHVSSHASHGQERVLLRSPRTGLVDHDATPTQTPRTARPLRKRHDLLAA